jgi:hypothetical protein
VQSSAQRCEQKGDAPPTAMQGPPEEQSVDERHGPPNMVRPPPDMHCVGSMAQSPGQVPRAGPEAMVAYMQRLRAPHQPQLSAAAQEPQAA